MCQMRNKNHKINLIQLFHFHFVKTAFFSLYLSLKSFRTEVFWTSNFTQKKSCSNLSLSWFFPTLHFSFFKSYLSHDTRRTGSSTIVELPLYKILIKLAGGSSTISKSSARNFGKTSPAHKTARELLRSFRSSVWEKKLSRIFTVLNEVIN